MGKAADNERIKLRATYLNNVAVGLVVAGGLIPLFALMQQSGTVVDWIDNHRWTDIRLREIGTVLAPVMLCFIAMTLARDFRRSADEVLKKLQD